MIPTFLMPYWKAIRAACAEHLGDSRCHTGKLSGSPLEHLMHVSQQNIPIVNTVSTVSTSDGSRLILAFVNMKTARSTWEHFGQSPGVMGWSYVLHNEEDNMVKMSDGSCPEPVAEGSLIERHPLTNMFVSAKFASRAYVHLYTT